MKKLVALSGILIMLFAGCSSKKPTVEGPAEEQQAKSGTEAPAESAADADTVVVDENGAVTSLDDGTVGADEEEKTLSALERRMQTVYFAFDKFNLTPEAQEKIAANSRLAEGDARAFNIKIEGNCDEWGSDEYNFALGLKRAKAAKDAMVANGVDEKRISMVSYGESNPVCMEKTRECWAKNRRDDFKLLP